MSHARKVMSWALSLALAFSMCPVVPAAYADTGAVTVTKDGTYVDYDTLQAAFAGAEPGSTITLNTDLALGSAVSIGKQLTLNLNGHTATSNYTVTLTDSADLTLQDTSRGAAGTYTATNVNAFQISGTSGSTASPALTVKSGTYDCQSSANNTVRSTIFATGGTVNVAGGTVKGSSAYGPAVYVTGAALNVSGGSITSSTGTNDQWSSTNNGLPAVYAKDSTTSVTGGTIENTNSIYGVVGLHASGGTAVISDGTIGCPNSANLSGKFSYALALSNSAKVTVEGGKFFGYGANNGSTMGVIGMLGKEDASGTPTNQLILKGGKYNQNKVRVTNNEQPELSEFTAAGCTVAANTDSDSSTYGWVINGGSAEPSTPTSGAAYVSNALGGLVGTYSSITEAAAALKDGYTLTLLDDVDIQTSLKIENLKNVTVDLNGHKFKNGTESSGTTASTLDISGCTGAVLKGPGSMPAIGITNASSVEIDGASVLALPIEEGTTASLKSGTVSYFTNNGTFYVSGGTVGTPIAIGTCVFTGGTFSFDPSAYVPAGYQVTQGSSTWTVTAKTSGNVAITDASGNTVYADTLAEALKGATDGSTIKPLANITETDTAEATVSAKKLTLDLNGKMVTKAATYNITGSLTVKNSGDESTGMIKTTDDSGQGFKVATGGSLTVESGNILTKKESVYADGGSVSIKGGKFTSSGSVAPLVYATNDAILAVTGGTFIANDYQAITAAGTSTASFANATVVTKRTAIYAVDTAEVTINSGDYLSTAGSSAAQTVVLGVGTYTGNFYVKGGYFYSVSSGFNYDYTGGAGKFIISGGKFRHEVSDTSLVTGCTCTSISETHSINGTDYKFNYEVGVSESDAAAVVTDSSGNKVYYLTLAEALKEAASGSTITVNKDGVSLDEEITIADKVLTFDLAGHDVAATAFIKLTGSANFTVKESTGAKAATGLSTVTYGGDSSTAELFVLEGVADSATNPTLNIEGGRLSTTQACVSATNGTVNITDGYIISYRSGNAIAYGETSNVDLPTIYIGSGATLNAEDGTVDTGAGKNSSDYIYSCPLVVDGGTAHLDGTRFLRRKGPNNGSSALDSNKNAAVYVINGANVDTGAYVEGGPAGNIYANYTNCVSVLNGSAFTTYGGGFDATLHIFGEVSEDSIVELEGGYFDRDLSSGDFTDYIPEGYTRIRNPGDNSNYSNKSISTYYYKVVTNEEAYGDKAVQVYNGDKIVGGYDTLYAALAAATDGVTIKLNDDVDERTDTGATKRTTTISASNVTLDLNGHTVTKNGIYYVEGSLTVKDGSAEGTGAINEKQDYLFGVQESGSLTIESGTFNSTSRVVDVNGANASATISGGSLTSTYNGNVTGISGSTVFAAPAVCARTGGTVTIEGGMLEATGAISSVLVAAGSSNVSISGGYFKNANQLLVGNNSTIAVTGGEFGAAVGNYVSDPYSCVVNTGEDADTYPYKVVKDKPTASVTKDGVTTNYLSFEDAVAAAEEGDEITLLLDVTDATPVLDKAGVTLNMNGHSITGELAVKASATIKGEGTIKKLTTSKVANIDCVVEINGVEIIGDGKDVAARDTEAINVGADTTVTVNSGWVKHAHNNSGGTFNFKGGTLNSYNHASGSSTTNFTGGTYNFDPTNSVFNGCIPFGYEATDNGDNTWSIGKAAEVTVSTAAEFKQAMEDPDVTKVTLETYTGAGATPLFALDADVTVVGEKTLDLNGRMLRVNQETNEEYRGKAIYVGDGDASASLTITGNGSEYEGVYGYLTGTPLVVKTGSTLNVEEGVSVYAKATSRNLTSALAASLCAIRVDGGTANINGGTVQIDVLNSYKVPAIDVNSGTLNVKGGAVVATTGAATGDSAKCIDASSDKAIVNISGGNLKSGDGAEVYTGAATPAVKVTGGTFAHDFGTANDESWIAEGYTVTDLGDGETYRYSVSNQYAAGIVRNGETTYYATVDAALAAIQTGDTLKLLANAGSGFSIATANVTVDTNGYTLAGLQAKAEGVVLTGKGTTKSVTTDLGTTITIKDGTVEDAATTWGATIYIEGGTVKNLDSSDPVYVSGGTVERLRSQAAATITGGTVETLDLTQGSILRTPNATVSGGKVGAVVKATSSNLSITGGLFGFDPSEYLTADYAASANTGADADKYPYQVAHITVVTVKNADGTETEYGSLADALAAAENGAVFTLVADAALDSAATVDKSITLDLAGHTLTSSVAEGAAFAVTGSDGKLTVKDSSATGETAGTGKITGAAEQIVSVSEGAGFTLESGTVASTSATSGSAIVKVSGEGSSFTMTSGSLETTAAGVVGIDASESAKVGITGGSVSTGTGNAIKGASGAQLDIADATVTSAITAASCFILSDNATATLSGNNVFTATGSNSVTVSVDSTAQLTVDGGTYTNTASSYALSNSGAVIVNDGTFTSANGSGIAVNCSTDDSDLTINGGTFEGGNYGGFLSRGTCTINGGRIKGRDTDIYTTSSTTLSITEGKFAHKPTSGLADGTTVYNNTGSDKDTYPYVVSLSASNAAASVTDAEGTVHYYASFAEALEAAVPGSTVKLTKDVELAQTATIGTDVTIDLNGQTITYTGEGAAAFALADDAKLTVTDASEGGKGAIVSSAAIVDDANGTVTLEGGSFTAGGKAGAVTSAKNATITGGTYNTDPSASVPEGYVVNKTTDADTGATTYTVLAQADVPFAVTDGSGNTTYYATFAEALTSAADGSAVTLAADATLDSAVTIDKAITLDLNGKTLTASELITITGTGSALTVKDSSATEEEPGTGKIVNSATQLLNASNGATLNIEGGTFNNNKQNSISVYVTGEGTSFNMSGGAIETEYGSTRGVIITQSAQGTITGGSITCSTGSALSVTESASADVSNLTVKMTTSGSYGSCFTLLNATAVLGEGNSFTATKSTTTVMDVERGAKLTVNGGSYAADVSGTKVLSVYDSDVEINDGTFTTTGAYAVSLEQGASNAVAINGGEFSGNPVSGLNVNAASGTTMTVAGGKFTTDLSGSSVLGTGNGCYTNTDSDSSTYPYIVELEAKHNSVASVTDDEGKVTYYTTIDDALANAAAGDTVALTKDATLFAATTVNKDITIDLAGKTLTYTGAQDTDAAFTVSDNATLTIKDSSEGGSGVLNATKGAAAQVEKGSKLVIEGGTVKGAITGEGTVAIDNGAVFDFDPADLIDADKQAVSKITDEGGNVTYKVIDKDSAVATIVDADGNAYAYDSLAEAVANAKGAVITLAGDVNVDATIAVTDELVYIDLNGHAVTYTGAEGAVFKTAEDATLVLSDASDKANGSVKTSVGAIVDNVSGFATVVSGNFDSGSDAAFTFDGNASVSGGSFSSNANLDANTLAPGFELKTDEAVSPCKYAVERQDGANVVLFKSGKGRIEAYKTLAEAVAASAGGEAIVLYGDVAESAVVTVDHDLSIALGGHKVDSSVDGAAIVVKSGAELVIGNGDVNNESFVNDATGADGVALSIEAGAKLQLEDAKYGKVTVGKIVNNGELSVGTGSATGAITGTGTVTGAEAGIVAADGSVTYYETLEEAVAAAKSGDTVKLVNDAALEVTLTIDKDIALDLGGKQLSSTGDGATVAIAAGKDVAIKNGTVVDASGTGGSSVSLGAGSGVTTDSATIGKVVVADAAAEGIQKTTGEDGKVAYKAISKTSAEATVTDGTGNTYYYEKVAAAVDNAPDGSTVTLTKDAALDEALGITEDITLDLGGKELSSTGDGATVAIAGDAKAVIKNGTVVNASGTGGNAIDIATGAELTLGNADGKATPTTTVGDVVNSGKLIVAGGATCGDITNAAGATVDVKGGTTGDIANAGTVTISDGDVESITTSGKGSATITGGTVGDITAGEGTNVGISGGKVTGSVTGEGTVSVSGGEFTGTDPSKLIDADHGISKTTGADGKTDYKVIAKADAEATVTDGASTYYYATLEEAVANAPAGSSVALLKDAALETTLTIDKDIALDLGGKQLSSTGSGATVAIAGDAKVAVKNGTVTDATGGEGGTSIAVAKNANATLGNGADGAETPACTVGTIANEGTLNVTAGATVGKITGNGTVTGYEASVTGADGTTSYYKTVEEAVEAAKDGDTVKLVDDATVEGALTIDKDITLDLGGKTIGSDGTGATIAVGDDKNVTIKNGTVTDATGDNGSSIDAGANSKVTLGGEDGKTVTTGKVTTDGSLDVNTGATTGDITAGAGSEVDVTGGQTGKIDSTGTDSKVDVSGGSTGAITTEGTASVTGGTAGDITGSGADSKIEVSGDKTKAGNITAEGSANVSGGDIDSVTTSGENASATITGGDIDKVTSGTGSKIEITGGDIDKVTAGAGSSVSITGGEIGSTAVGEGATLDIEGGSGDGIKAPALEPAGSTQDAYGLKTTKDKDGNTVYTKEYNGQAADFTLDTSKVSITTLDDQGTENIVSDADLTYEYTWYKEVESKDPSTGETTTTYEKVEGLDAGKTPSDMGTYKVEVTAKTADDKYSVTVPVDGKVVVDDTKAPMGEITVVDDATKTWDKLDGDKTFDAQYTTDQKVKIASTDGVGSGLVSIKYFVYDKGSNDAHDAMLDADQVKNLSDNAWTEGWSGQEGKTKTQGFSTLALSDDVPSCEVTIKQGQTCTVYALFTDAKGNKTYISSGGMMIYVPFTIDESKLGTDGGSTIKVDPTSGSDIVIPITEADLNGSGTMAESDKVTVGTITVGDKTLTEGTDYTVDANKGITIKNDALKDMDAGSYKLKVTYQKDGVTLNQATSIPLTIAKAAGKTTAKAKALTSKLTLNKGLKVKQGKNGKLKISWGKVKGVTSYKVYVQYCGKKYTKKSVVKVKGSKKTIKIHKIAGKKLNKAKNYKIKIVAYKGKKVVAKSIEMHFVGFKNTKYSNPKKIKLKSKKSVTLKVGKTSKIKAKVVLVNKKKKSLSNKHAAKFRYTTSDARVAKVSKKGKIKAIGKGTCTIFVYAKNGFTKAVKVTVK